MIYQDIAHVNNLCDRAVKIIPNIDNISSFIYETNALFTYKPLIIIAIICMPNLCNLCLIGEDKHMCFFVKIIT